MDVDPIEFYLAEGGLLSKRMPDFEFRPQQLDMARAVARSLNEARHLIVEAGTGTGKSLAYLIPAILWAVANNKKVVISTYTKTLQEQILKHDIPLISEKLDLSFRYSLCMGHENYLSLRRLKRASQSEMFARPQENRQLQSIFDWAGQTQTGLKTDLPFEPLPTVWEDVGRQKDLCLGKNCETYEACFYFKERRKWFGAHLLIVNHHLFFANVGAGGGVLPRFDAVVFDEAQNIEEAATSFLGLEISNTGMFYFLDRLYHPKTKRGTLARLEAAFAYTPQVIKLAGQARRAVDKFFEQALETYGRKERVLRFHKPPDLENHLFEPLEELQEALKTLEASLESEEDRLDVAAASNRCFEYRNSLAAFLHQHLEGYVYWLEVTERKRFPRVVLRGVPINLAPVLKEQVFDKIDRMILTSATLTTNRDFEFIKNRIGYDPGEEQVLDSPFDYETQALIYVAKDLPEPTQETGKYVEAIAARSRELIQASGGKTFILFTSYDVLNRVYDQLESLGREYRLLRQGELPTGAMIRRFKESPSVIFGTSSFWQGVDIPGEALTSVIITKLPFDVPNEPITQARLEDLRKNHIDPFVNYQIPRAIIQLKQGCGRLIRKRTDTGVISILDSRMVNRGYGKKFLDSLPPCRVVEDLREVREFLARSAEMKEKAGVRT